MPSTLHIHLLGGVRLDYGGEPLPALSTDRLQSLLAYLALHRGVPQVRRHLAFLFWPDSRERQAFTNLRNVLFRLRRALPEADRFLAIDTAAVCWRADAPFTLDAADFERYAAQADEAVQRGDSPAARAALEEAVAHYGGDLLPGLYDDWILPERERLHQRCARALEQLVGLLETDRAYDAALGHAQHLLRLDPTREPTYRLLMRLHALNRDRASVRRVYAQCVEVLARELDLVPEADTRALYERLSGEGDAAEADRPEDDGPAGGASGVASPEVPLVGRRAEWTTLREAWRRAATGQAHVVVVTGEAGIGKTRLAEELLEWVGRQGHAVARARSYAAEGRLAYAPVVEWLRAVALRPHIAALDPVWQREVARLLPELQADRPDRPTPASLQTDRQRLFEALARAVLAGGRPLLLFLDDAQWSDPDALEWLHFLLRFAPGAPLLVLGTARAEELEPGHALHELLLDLGRTGQVTEVPLAPIDAADTARLGGSIAGRALDAHEAERLYRETEGNPLFVVESVRAGLPPADATGPSRAPRVMPPTVHAVITRRLTQLSPAARALAGLAAVVGRAFTLEMLLRVGRLDEEAGVEALDELWQRRIVREYGTDAYDFTHDRLREGAYAAVSPARRHLLHRRVAEALEYLYEGRLEAVAAQVAAHYDLGGRPEPAIAFYRIAAHEAQGVGAHREAIQWLTRALGLLDALPRTRERDAHEVALLAALGVAQRIEVGHGAPEVEATYEKARGLSSALGATPQFFAVQRGRWSFHLIRSEYDTAQALAAELLVLAGARSDDALRLESYVALGLTNLWQGALSQAGEYLDQALPLYRPERHHAHALRYGQDPGVAARSLRAYVRVLRGDADGAAQEIEAVLALDEAQGHPFSLAYALQHAALIYQVAADAPAAYERATALLDLARERGFAYWLGPGAILQGWAMAAGDRPGEGGEGIERIREGLERHRTGGGRLSSTLWLGLLADAHARNGEVEAALARVEEALRLAEATGERVWEAELYRLRGTLLLRNGSPAEEAAACFEQAVAHARDRQEQGLELRAVLNLSRLLHRQGRSAEAYARLQAACDALEAGVSGADLAAARAALDAWR